MRRKISHETMKQEFYSLPLLLDQVILKKEHPGCSLVQSVAQQLHMILTTSFGEFQPNESFGCAIWDLDFDNITSAHKLKEFIRQSLLKSIQEHERRLENVRVELVVRQEQLVAAAASPIVKKGMEITITGLLRFTNERFIYTDSFFVGPLSY